MTQYFCTSTLSDNSSGILLQNVKFLHLSSSFTMTSGVHQGCILAQMLFHMGDDICATRLTDQDMLTVQSCWPTAHPIGQIYLPTLTLLSDNGPAYILVEDKDPEHMVKNKQHSPSSSRDKSLSQPNVYILVPWKWHQLIWTFLSRNTPVN